MNPLYEINYPRMAENMRERRFEDYRRIMQELLYTVGFPMEVILQGRNEASGSGPLLKLNAIKWERNEFGEIEVFLRAELSRYGEVNTLGIFRHSERAPLTRSSDQLEEALGDVIRKPLTEMLSELLKHFEEPPELVHDFKPETLE